MKTSAALVLTAVLLAPAAVRAECTSATMTNEPCLDAERFKPAVTTDGWVNAEGSGLHPHEDRWEFGGFINYSRNSLVAVNGGNVTTRFINGRMGIDLFGSATIVDWFGIGIGVPLFLIQTADSTSPVNTGFGGIGDVRIVPKFRILDDDRGPFGLGFALELRAPTHAGDYAGGTRAPVVVPKAIIDHRFGGLRLGANVGFLIREKTTFYSVTAGPEFIYAADIGYRFGGRAGKLEIGVEGNGGLGTDRVAAGTNYISSAPLELLPYAKIFPSDEWQIDAGMGLGLVAGYGVPLIRFFAGLRYHPVSHDADHDGVPDDRDQCVNQAEDRDAVEDQDGCPEDDADTDGVPDSEDKCPNQKETINGFEDEDGCPDEGPAKVIVEKGKITILEAIHFRTGSADIDPDSNSILNQVALTMKAHPEIKRIRVEGHTDETGSHERNVELSKQRAARVREYLVSRGVRKDRLSSEGYGPDRPIVQGTDDSARARNRRVEFVVEQ
jgi:outer membrane protein OmpA-like peptidoglycan-associated protein